MSNPSLEVNVPQLAQALLTERLRLSGGAPLSRAAMRLCAIEAMEFAEIQRMIRDARLYEEHSEQRQKYQQVQQEYQAECTQRNLEQRLPACPETPAPRL